jgi:hypothetical protein
MNASPSISFGFDEAAEARGHPEEGKTDNATGLGKFPRMRLPQRLVRQRWKRRHSRVWRFGLHCDECHRDQIVVPDDSNDIHHAALANAIVLATAALAVTGDAFVKAGGGVAVAARVWAAMNITVTGTGAAGAAGSNWSTLMLARRRPRQRSDSCH